MNKILIMQKKVQCRRNRPKRKLIAASMFEAWGPHL